MLVLAFDTTGSEVSIAIHGDGPTVMEVPAPRGVSLAGALLPLLLAGLRSVGVGLSEVGILSVSVGPGGFTGTRTGLAAAMGLRAATGVEIVAYSAFDVGLAQTLDESADWQACQDDDTTLVVQNTHRRDLFAQILRVPSQPVAPPRILEPRDAHAWARALRASFVAGDATAQLWDCNPQPWASAEEERLQRRPVRRSRGASLALLARRCRSCYPLAPLYLRRPAVSLPAVSE